MKKYLIIVFVLFTSCKPKDYRPDELYSWINDYMLSIKDKDNGKFLSLFSQDIRFYRPNQPTITGVENLNILINNYFNYYDDIFESLSVQEMTVIGNFAYVVCNYSVTARIKDSKEKFKDTGKAIYLFKQQLNRNWICTHAMWNNNNRSIDIHSQIPADFSGNWLLDLSRSTSIPEINSSTLFIVQNGNVITIKKSYLTKDKGIVDNSLEYRIGKEIITTNYPDTLSISCYWSPDKQSFFTVETILSVKNGVKHNYIRKSQYSITAKGETLTVVSDDDLSEGSFSLTMNRHIEMIYNKILSY